MLNDGRELQSKTNLRSPDNPFMMKKSHGVAGNGEREQSLLKSMLQQASNYRAYAWTAKDPGEQALIDGSGLCVTLKNHGESALICRSGLKRLFHKPSTIPMVVPALHFKHFS